MERSLASLNLMGLDVISSTIDAVQGREADVAIYSVTRSNTNRQIGFLADAPRLNVALSRPRQYLVIVGDHISASQAAGQNPFRQIVDYIERHPDSCMLRELRD